MLLTAEPVRVEHFSNCTLENINRIAPCQVMWIGVMSYVLMNLKKKIPLRANKLKPEKLNLIRLKSQNIMTCMLLFSYRHASHCKPSHVEGMDMWLKAFLEYFLYILWYRCTVFHDTIAWIIAQSMIWRFTT